MAWDCREPKRNKGGDTPMNEEKRMKIFQELMVKSNRKSEVFSKGGDYRMNPFQK